MKKKVPQLKTDKQAEAFLARDLSQQVRPIRNDAVDAGLDHARHVFGLVDRPDHDAQSERMGFSDERHGHIAEIGRPHRAACGLDRSRQ